MNGRGVATSPLPCPGEDELAAYFDGRLGAAARDDVDRHVDDCAECQAVFRAVVQAVPFDPDGVTQRSEPHVDSGPMPMAGLHIGRHVVLEVVGHGGMGVVVSAWDPKLDRRIAIKLVRPLGLADGGTEVSAGRARMLAEARALARVTHPNVLTVHDVGEHDGGVYVALEFVEGQSLAQWLRTPRPWREVVARYIDAGRGLEAVHAAGLVHRDFKPANVLLGDDGRVRVGDFGLVRAVTDDVAAGVDTTIETSAPSGTPAYMAPEQFMRLPADARADQFAFCVSLFEGLHGRRPFVGNTLPQLATAVMAGHLVEPSPRGPVPVWIDRIVRRGLSPVPANRYPDMAALLAALQRDPTRARRRRVLGVVAIAAVGAAVVGRQWSVQQARAACVAQGDRVDAVWGDAARDGLKARFAGSGILDAATTLDRLQPWLDDYAARWRDARVTACSGVDTLDTDERSRRDACLDERLGSLGHLVGAFDQLDAAGVHGAVASAANLPRIDECLDPRALARRPEAVDDPEASTRVNAVRDTLSEASTLFPLGRFDRAATLADEAIAAATSLDSPTLLAEATLVAGRVAEARGDFAAAESTLRAAYFGASAAGADDVAAAAAHALVRTVGLRARRAEDGLEWGELARVALERLGEPADGLRFGLLAGARAVVIGHSAMPADAIPLHRFALDSVTAALGPDHPQVASLLINAAGTELAVGDHAAALEHVQLAISRIIETLGPQHPDVASGKLTLGMIQASSGDYAAARATFAEALAIREAVLGERHVSTADVHDALGNIAGTMGDLHGAVTRHGRALAIREAGLPASHPSIAMSCNNLGLDHHKLHELETALVFHRRALAIREHVLPADHPEVASSLHNLCLLAVEAGATEDALAWCSRGVAMQERTWGPEHARLGIALYALGSAQEAAGALDDAEATLQRAQRIQASSIPADHPDVASVLRVLGHVARDRGRHDEAIELYRRGAEIFTKAFGDGVHTGGMLASIGEVELDRGRQDAAVAPLEQALAIGEAHGDRVLVARATAGLQRLRKRR